MYELYVNQHGIYIYISHMTLYNTSFFLNYLSNYRDPMDLLDWLIANDSNPPDRERKD